MLRQMARRSQFLPVSCLLVLAYGCALVSASEGAEGDLDQTFGSAGIVHTGSEIAADLSFGVVVRADNSIVVAGIATQSGSHQHVLLSFTPEGTPDSTFGLAGVAYSGLPSPLYAGIAIAEQEEGKIILAGRDIGTGNFVARFTRAGTLDPTFGVGGIAHTGVCSQLDADIALAIQSDGKIVLAGNHCGERDYVARLTPSGDLDPTFGSAGTNDLSVTSYMETRVAVAIQGDGKIILAGTDSNMGQDFVARFTSAGGRDSTFGDSGVVRTGLASDGMYSPVGVAIQSGDRVVLAGKRLGFPHFLLRFTPGGGLDSTFFAQHAYPRCNCGTMGGVGVAIQADGRIVLGGDCADGCYVGRFWEAGVPDGTFGSHGMSLLGFGVWDTHVAIAIQQDGNILLAGSDNMEVILARVIAAPRAVSVSEGELPQNATLLRPCVPSPFRLMTAIGFELPAPASVCLGVYDVSGRIVRRLLDGENVAAGYREVLWDGRDASGRLAPGGCYFYRLEIGSYSEARSVVLLR